MSLTSRVVSRVHRFCRPLFCLCMPCILSMSLTSRVVSRVHRFCRPLFCLCMPCILSMSLISRAISRVRVCCYDRPLLCLRMLCILGVSLISRAISKVYPFRLLLFSLCMTSFLVACLFIYVTVTICLSMAHVHKPIQLPEGGKEENPKPNTVHPVTKFIAPGAAAGLGRAAFPQRTFWRDHMDMEKNGMWNQLQFKLDLWNSEVLYSVKNWTLGYQRSTSILSRVGGQACGFNLTSAEKMPPNFFKLPLHIREFFLRMLCRDFPLVTDQPQLCQTSSGMGSETPPFLLLAIRSQDDHYEQRKVIRETWGKEGHVKGSMGGGGLIRRVFLLGRGGARPNRTQEKLLRRENKHHRDLLRWDFKDTAFNLTLKDVLFWNWLSHRCPQARFIFKGDDNVFIKTPALLDYLQQQVDEEEKKAATGLKHDMRLENFVVGDVVRLAHPVRSEDMKHYIPESLYTGIYPTYPAGGGVVYSGALALRLQVMSQKVFLFPINEVYMGMCLERLGVIPMHQPAFLTFHFPKEEKDSPCAYHNILVVNKRSPEMVRKLWEEVLTPLPGCTTPKPTPKPEKIIQKPEIDIMDLM